jgi:hypothetical protein
MPVLNGKTPHEKPRGTFPRATQPPHSDTFDADAAVEAALKWISDNLTLEPSDSHRQRGRDPNSKAAIRLYTKIDEGVSLRTHRVPWIGTAA